MNLRISDTFTESLGRLTGDEQKSVKTTAFDLQLNLANPGNRFHKLDKSRDKNFWSLRVSGDLRLIVHKTGDSLLLCYVDHHDKAYAWAERRKLETHPATGAAQLVEIRERIEEIVVPRYIESIQPAPPKPPVLAHVPEQDLLTYGVPADWIADVRSATEDDLLTLAEHLPREAAEALLDLATGSTPRMATIAAPPADPFEHPDAQRRFRLMQNVEELERALEYPWDKWTVFLHPAQREAVERNYGGPARISGSAGTGKTIVALHRAVFLARTNPDARVLLTTFSTPLANALRAMLRRLIGNEPRIGERLEVHSLDEIGLRLHDLNVGPAKVAPDTVVHDLLAKAAVASDGTPFKPSFLISEWEDVIDAWQLDTWESYRDVQRLGRKTRLPETRRKDLWRVAERVRNDLAAAGLVTHAALLARLSANLRGVQRPLFDFIVVDEAQDLSVPQLRLLAALGGGRPNALFFTGDLGQRIFQLPFSWKTLGVDIRGRSRTLRINYRTSHQIRAQADRLLDPEVRDVDGNVEDRRGALSVFNGPPPTVRVLGSVEDEVDEGSKWIKARRAEGVPPDEIALIVRSSAEVPRAREAAERAALPHRVLDDRVETVGGQASVCTMHLAKGLEFRAVAVMACDDEVIPLKDRIESVTDDSDLEEVYDTERHLLYVACTRARDHLLVTGVKPGSEFLADLAVKFPTHR
jgi:superfamily I DNA/RNA helicase/mRNA-degrading endonuclease RelE of RelBE toxin-antitoxin system